MLLSAKNRLAPAVTFCLMLVGCGYHDSYTAAPVIPTTEALCTPNVVSQETTGTLRYEGLTMPALDFAVSVDPRCPYPVRFTDWTFQLVPTTVPLKDWALHANGGDLSYGRIIDPTKEFTELNPSELFLNTSKDTAHSPPPTAHLSLRLNTIGLNGAHFSGARLVSFVYEVVNYSGPKQIASPKTGFVLEGNQRDIVRFTR